MFYFNIFRGKFPGVQHRIQRAKDRQLSLKPHLLIYFFNNQFTRDSRRHNLQYNYKFKTVHIQQETYFAIMCELNLTKYNTFILKAKHILIC